MSRNQLNRRAIGDLEQVSSRWGEFAASNLYRQSRRVGARSGRRKEMGHRPPVGRPLISFREPFAAQCRSDGVLRSFDRGGDH